MYHFKKTVLFDIGGTTLISAVAENNIIKNIEEDKIDRSVGSQSILQLMKKKLDFVENFDAISISAPGVLNVETGEVIHCTDTVKNYLGFNYFQELESYGVPMAIDNDLNCAALGEYHSNSFEGSMYQINVGTGVGGAFIIDGSIYRGSNNTAGEIGNLNLSKGVIDDLCSTRGMVERINARGEKVADGKEVVKLLGKNEIVDEEFDVFIDNLATLSCGIILLLNPDTLIIGGGISEAENIILKPLLISIQKKIPKYYLENTTISTAKSGNNAGIYGAYENIKRGEINLD